MAFAMSAMLRCIFSSWLTSATSTPGALGDARAARAVDEVRLAALGDGHRTDHCDLTANLTCRRAGRSFIWALTFWTPGSMPMTPFRPPICDAAWPSCFSMSSKSKLTLGQLFGHLLGFGRSTLFDGLFDEADDVALAEDAAGDALGVERLKRLGRSPTPEEFDRQAGDGAHRKRRAAAAVAVRAGEHEAGERQAFVEALGGFDRVLAGEAVRDQQDFAGLGDAGDLGGFAPSSARRGWCGRRCRG